MINKETAQKGGHVRLSGEQSIGSLVDQHRHSFTFENLNLWPKPRDGTYGCSGPKGLNRVDYVIVAE